MNVMEFSMLMSQKGCVGNENRYCGSFNGYPFTARFSSGKTGGRTVASLQILFNKAVPNRMAKEIQRAYRGQVQATANNGAPSPLTLILKARTNEEFGNLLDSVLGSITSIAPKYGLFIPNACPICGQTACDSYAYIKNNYRAAHASCVQANMQATHTKVDKNLREGSYALGILGAIVGAIVGAIPSIVVLFLFETLVLLLFAFVPLGAYYGYKLFNGKMTKAALPIVIVVSILSIPVIQYGEFLVDEIVNYSAFYSPADYFYDLAFAMEYNPSSLLSSWALMLLFVILGIFIVLSLIRRTGQHDIIDSSFSEATLRPINPAAPIGVATPAGTVGPATSNTAPIAEATPVAVAQTPAAPAVSEQAQTSTAQAPAVSEQAQTSTAQAPAVSEQAQTSTAQAPEANK